MKRILALMVVALLLIGGAGATKRPLMGDEGALSTDVTTDATGIGVIIAAANGLQADVDALEAGVIAGFTVAESAPASYVTASYTSNPDGANNGITWTANATNYGGTLGNAIDIVLSDPGEDTTACSVSEIDDTPQITVTLSYGTGAINATAQDVIDCVLANATAAAIVTPSNYSTDDGTGTVAAFTKQDLSGGVNGTAGTLGQIYYYAGDLFYLRSGSTFYDATWAQWDGADTDGTPTSSRSYATTATVTAEQITSTDDITAADDVNTVDVVASGNVTGEQITSTDDGAIAGLLTVGETLGVGGEATFGASVVFTPVAKAVDYTILDSDASVFSVGNNTANQTLTLPTAADNAGRFVLVSITTDPGDQNVVIDGEGDETVGGAATKTCTDAAGSFYLIYCDGLAWRLVSYLGTWT